MTPRDGAEPEEMQECDQSNTNETMFIIIESDSR